MAHLPRLPGTITSSTMRPPVPASSRTREIRILLIEDHPIVRECLELRFSRESDLTVCASVGSASAAFPAIEQTHPDLAIVDISLPDAHGLELIKDIHARFPQLRMVVFSMHDEELYGERALRAGARGYVTKNEPPGRIVQAVREVFAGRLAVSDALAQKLLSAMHSSNASTSSNIELLSDRELEVFQLLGQGVGTREIAERLNRGVKTIETYRTRIKEKLAVTSASELIVRAATWVAGRS